MVFLHSTHFILQILETSPQVDWMSHFSKDSYSSSPPPPNLYIPLIPSDSWQFITNKILQVTKRKLCILGNFRTSLGGGGLQLAVPTVTYAVYPMGTCRDTTPLRHFFSWLLLFCSHPVLPRARLLGFFVCILHQVMGAHWDSAPLRHFFIRGGEGWTSAPSGCLVCTSDKQHAPAVCDTQTLLYYNTTFLQNNLSRHLYPTSLIPYIVRHSPFPPS